MQKHLPDIYDFLEMDCNLLPSNQTSPVEPFLGFVVNLNVVSRCHRDGGDRKFCVVVPIGEFEGGELCLMEPGLVLPLTNGDVTLFPSCSVTHFNLHYVGERASLVLHTDKEIEKWRLDRNGWENNVTLS